MDNAREIVSARRYIIDRYHRLNCAPTVVIDMDAAIDPALAWIDRTNARGGGTPVALTHVILKAVAMALREHIFYNYDYDGRYRIIPNDKIDIGVPIEVEGAPAFVVVPDTDTLSVGEIARVYTERSAAARSSGEEAHSPFEAVEEAPLIAGALVMVRALAQAATTRIPPLQRRWRDFHHRVTGSFIVNDVHESKVTAMHGQIAYPSFAGLSVLGVRDELTVAGGTAAVRRMLPLALEFDHKLVDAGVGAKFLAAIRRNLEEPEKHCA